MWLQRDVGSITEYYRRLLASTGPDHRYGFAFYGDDEEARRFAIDRFDASPSTARRGT